LLAGQAELSAEMPLGQAEHWQTTVADNVRLTFAVALFAS